MPHAAGFTRVELLATLAVGVVLGAVGAVVIPKLTAGGKPSLQLQDAMQQRGIIQALTNYASENRGQYPLPSVTDRKDTTVPELGEAKNTTANIFSLLWSNCGVTAELYVSPMEKGNVKVCPHAHVCLARTVNGQTQYWVTEFSADFTSKEGGNFSYSHLQPSSGRMERWSNTMDARQPVLSNRGPQFTGISPSVTLANPNAITLKRGKWSGNVAYADNHVSFEDGYGDPSDNRFFDEPRDPANAYLGIFTKAGKEAADFTAIWD